MFIHFTFKDGSNPYIATSTKAFWYMVKNYNIEQIGERRFIVHGKANLAPLKPCKVDYRSRNKAILRSLAVDFSYSWENFNYSYFDIADWQEFFTEYGRKYGLLKEFHENAIC